MNRSREQDVAQLLPALMRYARTLTRDDAAAEDLLQDALLRAHERRATFRPGASLRHWLFAILHNSFVSGWRRNRSEIAKIDRLAELQLDHEPATQEQAAYLRQIAARFDALPDRQREVLHLVAVEGLNYQEVADALAIPVGTVMSRLSRARARLRVEDDEAVARKLHIIRGRE